MRHHSGFTPPRSLLMPRPQKNPLRPLTPAERTALDHVSRSQTEPAAHVAHAKSLLAVADGNEFTAAAAAAGRKSGDAVAQLVSRFNREGLAAIEPGHGGGQRKQYTEPEQERIVRELRRPPDREADGTATWSLMTLRAALRRAPDGLPGVSTSTIWYALHDAGFVWGKDRSWCETGEAIRKRKSGVVTVTDPDATPKKTRLRQHTCKPSCRCGPKTKQDHTRRCRIPAPSGIQQGSRRPIHMSMCATGRPSCSPCSIRQAVWRGSRVSGRRRMPCFIPFSKRS